MGWLLFFSQKTGRPGKAHAGLDICEAAASARIFPVSRREGIRSFRKKLVHRGPAWLCASPYLLRRFPIASETRRLPNESDDIFFKGAALLSSKILQGFLYLVIKTQCQISSRPWSSIHTCLLKAN